VGQAGEAGGDGQWRGHEVVSAPRAKGRTECGVSADYGKPDLEKF
jgi:hypothetical protein